MKKTLTVITMIMILTLSIILTACNPSNNDNGNNDNGDNGNPIEYTKFNVDYIGSLTADITNATAKGF